ncbi:hypothetical protein RM392_004707 [Enterobacter cloacae]|uniref:hypothetical protein n=1 Tax=Enterobacter bugandensis TaxID=881260 RepID=UPI00287454BD|nr:hypothetical protein [Enterobacter cloacae]
MDWWNLSELLPATPGYGAIYAGVIFSNRGRLHAPSAHLLNACALLGILISKSGSCVIGFAGGTDLQFHS